MRPYEVSMSELIVCGFAGVCIVDSTEGREAWRWRPEEDAGLPAYLRDPAAWATSDCKPVRGGRQILITSSLSGIALVGRETKRTSFYATGENAHSADLLPGNRIAVATSGEHQEARVSGECEPADDLRGGRAGEGGVAHGVAVGAWGGVG